MAEQVNVFGRGEIFVSLPGGSPEKLGEAMDMTDIVEESRFHDVPMDRNGGSQGPPGEVQYLGSITRIRLNLSTFDPAVALKVRRRSANATFGTVLQGEVGKLMLNPSTAIRITLRSATTAAIRNFPTCLVRSAVDIGYGTKFSSLQCEFEAHRTPSGNGANVLEDDDDTGLP